MMLRWITASVYKYFDVNKGPYFLGVEGNPIELDDKQEWAELNISDIRPYKFSGSEKYEVDVHVMCVSRNQETIYDVQRVADFFANLMKPIIVFKLGDGDAEIGCLRPRVDIPSHLDIITWGRVILNDGPTRVFQISVHGFFQMDL